MGELNMNTRFLASSAAWLACLVTASAGAQSLYRVTDIAPAEVPYAVPRINNSGMVAGSIFYQDEFHAFVHDDVQGLHILPMQGITNIVHALSDSGEVGGTCQGLAADKYQQVGCAWRGDGTPIDPLLLGIDSTFADFNRRGFAAASYSPQTRNKPSHRRAIVVSPSGKRTELGSLGGPDSDTWATAITEDGRVVGLSTKVEWGPSHAFIYDGTGMHELDLAGNPGRALDVNHAGDAVGDDDNGRPILFRGGAAIDLGTVMDGGSAYASAINDRGDIVGCEERAGKHPDMAIIWRKGKKPVRLESLLDPVSGAGWRLFCATGINRNGQITGYGTLNDESRVFRLTPLG